MAGLMRILKRHGAMTVSANGETIRYLWDYARDVPVTEAEMPEGSERWRESERVKWAAVKEQLDASRQRNAEGF